MPSLRGRSYVGVAPSEYSSGASRVQGEIIGPATATHAGCCLRPRGTARPSTPPERRCATGGSAPAAAVRVATRATGGCTPTRCRRASPGSLPRPPERPVRAAVPGCPGRARSTQPTWPTRAGPRPTSPTWDRARRGPGPARSGVRLEQAAEQVTRVGCGVGWPRRLTRSLGELRPVTAAWRRRSPADPVSDWAGCQRRLKRLVARLRTGRPNPMSPHCPELTFGRPLLGGDHPSPALARQWARSPQAVSARAPAKERAVHRSPEPAARRRAGKEPVPLTSLAASEAARRP